MQIIPKSDILIKGIHSPAGVIADVDNETALLLVSQRIATFAPTDPQPEATIETASAAPAVETSTRAPSRRNRSS